MVVGAGEEERWREIEKNTYIIAWELEQEVAFLMRVSRVLLAHIIGMLHLSNE